MRFTTVACLVLLAGYSLSQGTEEAHGSELNVEEGLRSSNVGKNTDDEVVEREEQAMSSDGFSIAEQKALREAAETHQFQAEVSRLMEMIINSLYSNREIFLRELISNASDALDKIRFQSLTDPSILGSNTEFLIKIKADPKTKSLHIIDTGVGMTKEELVANLGTIAKSGTKAFFEELTKSNADTSNLIGQFGVGFYSAYLVADKVTVVTKHINDTQQVWESDVAGGFSVAADPRGNTLGRGTHITLQLKEDDDTLQYLRESVLRDLVKRYSQFITFPIQLWVEKKITEEVPLSEAELAELEEEEEEEAEETVDLDGADGSKEPKEEKPKTKTVTKTIHEWEQLNTVKPIWSCEKADITDEEYDQFYKSFSRDSQAPLEHTHFKAEGDVEFKALLFIPAEPPRDMFLESYKAKNLKLFVRRVFVTDDFNKFLPTYLSFLVGVVDSDDLPLNVSREMLQKSKIVDGIKKKLVRKAIAMFQELKRDNEESFTTFFKNFGTSIKLGVLDDAGNRARLAKLLMFRSSNSDKLTDLDAYVERMSPKQTQIYFIAGEDHTALSSSPLVERALSRGYEILYLTEPIDEYVAQHMGKFDGKYRLTNLGKEEVKFEDEVINAEREEELKDEFKPTIEFLKRYLRPHDVDKVIISKRLTESPAMIVASSYSPSANMMRIQKAQTLRAEAEIGLQKTKKILEVNPSHPIIRHLNRLAIEVAAAAPVSADDQEGETQEEKQAQDTTELDAKQKRLEELSDLLFESSMLASGFYLENPVRLANQINSLVARTLAIPDDESPADSGLITVQPKEAKESEEEGEEEEDDDESEDADSEGETDDDHATPSKDEL